MMLRRLLARLLCLVALAGAATLALAQSIEIISLKHRNAEQILPQVKPFVEAGGGVSGMNNQIFLRTTAKNQAELRKLIAALDVPLRRLLISVRQEGGSDDAAKGAAASGSVVLGNGAPQVSGRAKVYSSDRRSQRDTQQQVQTIEGGRAGIHVGQSFMLPMRQVMLTASGAVVSETLVQRDLGTGFVAVPRLSGDTVTLEISPMDETAVTPSGSVTRQQHLSTTVSGRLGEWIELGSSGSTESGRETGVTVYGTRSAARQARFLLKVDELP